MLDERGHFDIIYCNEVEVAEMFYPLFVSFIMSMAMRMRGNSRTVLPMLSAVQMN